MRVWFYISWVFYISVLFFDIFGIKMPCLSAREMNAFYYISLAVMGVSPLCICWLNENDFSIKERDYLMGFILSVSIRILFFIGEACFGFKNKDLIMSVSFFIIAIFISLDIKRKLDKLSEKQLL